MKKPPRTRSVLVADDDPDLVDLLSRRLESLGLSVDSAPNAMTALGKIEESPPDLVVIDVNMPQGNGLGVCEMLADHETLSDIPRIVLTGSPDKEVVRRCYQMCAYYIPKCPNVWSRVEPLVRELLELGPEPQSDDMSTPNDDSNLEPAAPSNAGSDDLVDAVFAVLGVEDDGFIPEDDARTKYSEDPPWVLSIEDDDDVALALKLRLRELGVIVVRASSGSDGYRKAFFSAPRAILLDYELPSGNGDYVLRRLKESPATAAIPVIMLTGRREAHIERQVRALGADDFLTKPFNWTRVRAALLPFLEEGIKAPATPRSAAMPTTMA